ncbi:MAG: N-6 DNA methylase [Gemmatimonadetes bacterium]|nr:N-6 DNA methylase [Gemmatimonadota bacterium]
MPQQFLTERDVEHYLKRLFEEVQDFKDIRSDVPIDGGRADLVIYSDSKPRVIIEVKRQSIDPFDLDVINQAAGYAVASGAEYFATTNGRRFILFETFRAGVPLMQRRLKAFRVADKLAEEVRVQITEGVRWLELDDAFLARLGALHEVITPATADALRDQLKSAGFRTLFEQWVQEQGFAFEKAKEREQTLSIIASQASYLRVNKILFYKVLETGYAQLPRLRIASASRIEAQLQRHFDAVLSIDYRAVFERGVFDEIPIPADVAETLAKFITELEGYDFSKIKSDVIGRIYERLIPLAERKALGQYYTPPQIVDLMVRLTLKDPNAKVLDPACGSGSFLVKAYHRFLELKGKARAANQKEHQQVLDQLVGVEINQFPAHLSVINLEMQNIGFKSDRINVLVSDFFDVNNFGFNNRHRLASLDKPDAHGATYRFFDAVVANPPYIRQEQITQKEKLLQLMKHYGVKLDRTSDIYSYFFAHASHFLKPNGRLGFITSNKWLEVKYGESLQKFFLANHRILAIIEFDAGAFEEALVNTCVVILEKEKDVAARDANQVRFVRVKKPLPTDDLVRMVEGATSSRETAAYRLALVQQSELHDNTKWSLYIRAPPIYHKILNHPKMTTLEKVAHINRGITSGANGFFYLTAETARAWGVEKRFLRPLVKSPREVRGLALGKEDCSSLVLNVPTAKAGLQGTGVLKYIAHGEDEKLHRLPTVANRAYWYDLGLKTPGAILFARKIWKDIICTLNTAQAFADQPFYEITPLRDDDALPILISLRSSVTALFFELHGRSYGGGVLELAVYEASKLPVLDPTSLTQAERDKMNELFKRLAASTTSDVQGEVDRLVFQILGLSEAEANEVQAAARSAQLMRSRRRDKNVLVG